MDGGWWVCCCSGVGRQQDAEAGIQPRGTGAPLVLEPWICRSLLVYMALCPWASSSRDGTRQLTRSGGNAGSSCAGAARGSWTRVARVR